jgi:hypothetical protein
MEDEMTKEATLTKLQLENHMTVLGVERNQWPTKRRDLVIAYPYNRSEYLRFSKQGPNAFVVTVEQAPTF